MEWFSGTVEWSSGEVEWSSGEVEWSSGEVEWSWESGNQGIQRIHTFSWNSLELG